MKNLIEQSKEILNEGPGKMVHILIYTPSSGHEEFHGVYSSESKAKQGIKQSQKWAEEDGMFTIPHKSDFQIRSVRIDDRLP